ncbi:MAG: hypothetical protein ACLP7O_15190 [Terracidiphilus sp.]
MATKTTVPYLTPDARLYKYARVPDGRWKYRRADYDDLFLKQHSVFLPKSNHPIRLEGGYYVACDEGKWHYWLMLAEEHLTRTRFAAMFRRIALLPLPAN